MFATFAIAGLVLVLVSVYANSSAPALPPPATPGSFADQFQRAVQDAGGTQGLPYKAIFAQSHLETGGGTSNGYKLAHNGFGFHASGPGNAFWDGNSTYKTTNGEVLRVYRTLADSIKDYLRLIQARYPQAVAAAETGSARGYFAGLVAGGYAEAATYFPDLLARYKAIYSVDA